MMSKMQRNFYYFTATFFAFLLFFYAFDNFSKSTSGVQRLILKIYPSTLQPFSVTERNFELLSSTGKNLKQLPLTEVDEVTPNISISTPDGQNLPSESVFEDDDLPVILTDEQQKVVDDSLAFQNEILKLVTPEGFVDVPKNGANPAKFLDLKPKADGMKHDTGGGGLFSATRLWQRAKQFGKETALGGFLAEQARRRELVGRSCTEASSNIPSSAQSRLGLMTFPRMIVDRIDHLTFCPIYKSASTSWSVNLLQMRGLWKSKGEPKHGLQATLKATFPSVPAAAGAMMTADSIKFMVVRHPFDRLVSCYRDKYKDARKGYYYKMYGEKMVQRYRKIPKIFTSREAAKMLTEVRLKLSASGSVKSLKGNPYANPIGPTFEEFVKFISHSTRSDEHWRPYYQHCRPCFVKFDFFLKFERLYDESKQFIEFLNRTRDIEVRWDNRGDEGVSSREVACQYFKTLTIKTMEKLLNKYAIDFILFEYSADEYVKCLKDYIPGLSLKIKVPKIHPRDFSLILPVR